MPNTKSNRRGQEPEKNRKERLSQKSSSFHGVMTMKPENELRRPKTVPELFSTGGRGLTGVSSDTKPKLTKLLLNVTIQGTLGDVKVLISPESTVDDLVTAAVKQYSKEGRRPMLRSTDPSGFDLHYSQFSLESIGRGEKLMELGSRNFFLCERKAGMEGLTVSGGGGLTAPSSSSCSKQAEGVIKRGFPWLKFMGF
ncbi:hypothetical protein CFOL_v3_05316 [Cephalotus follicularis]|uniref:DUF7054 domain-containing protein n=1 Tax=Cephalotus follicularis TaxID=3775 RepID=A0A1Q3B1G2_CEPFO|nr:hypothetical protein CFOL_v3_05316 [Cephalotus follicularis]